MIGPRRARFRIVLALASLLAPAIGAATTASPANAADAEQTVRLETEFNGDGKALANISFTWRDATTVSYSAAVTDVCPPDRHGAYLAMHVRYMDGTAQWISVAKDTDGCGTDPSFGSGSVAGGKRIKNLYFLLAEKEGDTGQVYDVAPSATFDNPYTG
jgi:hypothetical protein